MMEQPSSLWNQLRSAAPGTPAADEVGQENMHVSNAKPPPAHHQQMLCVPAEAWKLLHERLAAMEASNRETKQFLRAHLRLERARRERGATRIQAVWRARATRRSHPCAVRFAALRTAARRAKSFDAATRLHVSAPRATLRGATAALRMQRGRAPLPAVQGLARGFLVRRRVARWRLEWRAALRIQAALRGMRGRGTTRTALREAQLEARVAALEAALAAEQSARELSEAYLRRLGEAVRGLHSHKRRAKEAQEELKAAVLRAAREEAEAASAEQVEAQLQAARAAAEEAERAEMAVAELKAQAGDSAAEAVLAPPRGETGAQGGGALGGVGASGEGGGASTDAPTPLPIWNRQLEWIAKEEALRRSFNSPPTQATPSDDGSM